MFFFENEFSLRRGTASNPPTFRHYTALGLTKSAPQKEIKENFRKLALKMHPDKGGDAAEFTKLREAYNVLRNPRARALYDNAGDQGTQENAREMPEVPTTKTISLFLDLSLEEIYTGVSKTINYTRSRICLDCAGRGASATTICSLCGGVGSTTSLVRMGPVVLENVIPCRKCQGSGETFNFADQCIGCCGQKVLRGEDCPQVDIPSVTS